MKIVIVGAGISGLASAWYLNKKFGKQAQIRILEKSDRVGGWIHTINEKGFLFEQGPRGFRPTGKGKTTLSLVKELGLEPIAANAQAKKRYLLHHGKLCAFSPLFLFRQGFLSAIFHDLRTPPSTEEDETIADFFRRRFNDRITERLIDPLVKGIFGGDMEKLSIRSCFPMFWEFERQGSLIKGMSKRKKEKSPASLYSFKGGMETLPRTLAEKVDAEICLSREVKDLKEIEADLIVSTLPMPGIAAASIATVSLGWEGELLKKPGFGFLVPSQEQEEFLGMTWDSSIFPEQNHGKQTRLCVMIDGAIEKNFLSIALKCVEKHMKISRPPDESSISVARHAIPQYMLGHHAKVETFKTSLPSHIRVVGNSYEGVGVNDCIAAAKRDSFLT